MYMTYDIHLFIKIFLFIFILYTKQITLSCTCTEFNILSKVKYTTYTYGYIHVPGKGVMVLLVLSTRVHIEQTLFLTFTAVVQRCFCCKNVPEGKTTSSLYFVGNGGVNTFNCGEI